MDSPWTPRAVFDLVMALGLAGVALYAATLLVLALALHVFHRRRLGTPRA